MKIAMVTCSAFPFHNSGVAYVVHNIAKELIAMGHGVTVIGLSQKATTLTYSGYEVIGLALPGASHNFASTFKENDYNNSVGAIMLEHILGEINPDVVHFHALNTLGANMVKTAKTLGYKTVVTMHDWWWMCPFANLADNNHKPCHQLKINHEVCSTCIQTAKTTQGEDYITKRSAYLKGILKDYTDLIIPVSKYVESFLEPNGITGINITTIPNGAEPYNKQGGRRRTPESPESPQAHQKTITFGFLGGKHELKGHDLLLQACQELSLTNGNNQAKVPQNYQVHIHGALQLGSGISKKVLAYLKSGNLKGLLKKIKRHLPNDRPNQKRPIIYYPLFKPEEKDGVYENMDILLALSKVKESSSLVVREALIRGIPVITTPSGGPEEVIIHGKSGIILKETSPRALKSAMEQILTTNSLNNMEEYLQNNPYTYTTKDQAVKTLAAYERCFE